jgi:hypothetical protein
VNVFLLGFVSVCIFWRTNPSSLLSSLSTIRPYHAEASNENAEEEAEPDVTTVEWVYSFQKRAPLSLPVGQTLIFEFNDMHDVWAFTVSACMPLLSFMSIVVDDGSHLLRALLSHGRRSKIATSRTLCCWQVCACLKYADFGRYSQFACPLGSTVGGGPDDIWTNSYAVR